MILSTPLVQSCKPTHSSSAVSHVTYVMLTTANTASTAVEISKVTTLKVNGTKSKTIVNSSAEALDQRRHTPEEFLSHDVQMVPNSQSNSLQNTLKFSFFMQTITVIFLLKKSIHLVRLRLHICSCVHLLCFNLKTFVEILICIS